MKVELHNDEDHAAVRKDEPANQAALQRLQRKKADADRQGALFVECMTDNQRQFSMFGGE